MRHIFAHNLSYLRRREGLSVKEMASELGVTEQRYWNWEMANSYPCMNMIIKICDYFQYKDIYSLVTTKICLNSMKSA